MNTIMLWLLVSVGANGTSAHAQVVERFTSKEQCLHVQSNLPTRGGYTTHLTRCIQAEIVLTK